MGYYSIIEKMNNILKLAEYLYCRFIFLNNNQKKHYLCKMKHRQASNGRKYTYNAHRLDSVTYDDAISTVYHYDQFGQVDSLYDESGVMCYYGNMGEVTEENRIYAVTFYE